jgi:hypothetical protein
MATRPREERIRIETGSKTSTGVGGTTWVTTSSEERWCSCRQVSSTEAEKYQSIDGKVDYEFGFLDWPTVTMQSSRFVWVTNGHPLYLRIYYPVRPPERRDSDRRAMKILVRDSGEVASA